MKATIFSTCIMCLILFLTIPNMAFGYIDPGTGSYLLQILVASLLGSLLALKIFWQRIKTFLGNFVGRRQK